MVVAIEQRGIMLRSASIATVLVAALALNAGVHANETASFEPDYTGIKLTLDDDLFSGPGHDRDYTGGFMLTVSGARTSQYWFSLHPLLAAIDSSLGVGRKASPVPAQTNHALGLGALAFTPQNITSRGPIIDDRPYSSLVFLSSARRQVMADRDVVYNTGLTLSVLGLSAAGDVHRAVHSLTGSEPIRGYRHQISAGGEPTLRYNIARQSLLASGPLDPAGHSTWNSDVKWTLAGSVGTITEGSIALNSRWGRIESPWWSFSPEQNAYLPEMQPETPWSGAHPASEAFAIVGVRLKARAYNAFLQGQFRDSIVRYSADDLNPLLAEAWGGFVMRQSSGLEIRYLARWGSPELRHGPSSRTLVWGSLEISRSFAP